MSNATRIKSIVGSGSLSQPGSFLGSLGIAASLLLVAYELQQSRDIAEVQLASQRLDLQTRIMGRVNVDTQVAFQGMLNYGADKEMSEEHWKHAIDYSANRWESFSLTHLTYEKNLLSEMAWAGQVTEMQIEICDTDTGEFFEMIGSAHAFLFTPAFSEVVSELINKTDCQVIADLGAADIQEPWRNKTRDTAQYYIDRVEAPK